MTKAHRPARCLALVIVASCAPAALRDPARDAGAARAAAGLEVLEVERIEQSPHRGTLNVRVANTAQEGQIVAVDVRAEPGMWLGPVGQSLSLHHLPPGSERRVSVEYALPGLSPEARLRVRIGLPEFHPGGWLHTPEPAAVRVFELGDTPEAAAFLDRFDRHATPHLTIFAVRGMFTSAELGEVAAERTRAIAELSRMLDVRPPPGIRLVFYPDGESKTADTDHIGAGLTQGTTIVEVRNDSVKLDPYHELVHVMAGQLGWAPAWLNEGLAVFAAEQLGSDALAQQGSAGRSVTEATCAFHATGELLPVAELVRLPDIGPEETRPHITYAQAASFVGYLVRRFGMPALRRAYATLSPMAADADNDAAFRQAFGVDVGAAGEGWLEEMRSRCRRGPAAAG